jgi:signal transduction histidine kinase
MKDECDGTLTESTRGYLERIQSAAARMSDLLRDMLAFARITMRPRPFERVRVQQLIQEVLRDLDLMIDRTQARIDVDADVELVADPGQLRQLLNHLVMNAIKFQRTGVEPHLSITAGYDLDGGSGGFCRIVVEDNGIGFDNKYAERIFEPLQRLHSMGEYAGTGMGLAICRRIAERHGGTVVAHGVVGEGSRFTVSLPLLQADPEIHRGQP